MKRSTGYKLAALLVTTVVVCLGGKLATPRLSPSVSSQSAATLSTTINTDSFTSALTKLETEQDFDFIDFPNSQVGWAASRTGLLYRTIDEGKSWKVISSPGGTINSVHFSSDSVGWVVQQEYTKDFDKTSFEARILFTNDAGKSWRVQFAAGAVELLRINFSGNTGWVIGSRFFNTKGAIKSEVILLRTSDEGTNWIPCSSELNTFLAGGSRPEFPADIRAVGSDTLHVLTGNGMLLTTTDRGLIWRSSEGPALNGMTPQKLLLAPDNSPNVLAGIGGNHGVASILAARKSNESWISNNLTSVFLRDAVFLTGKDVVAVGSMLSDVNHPWDQQKEGVVLYSTDQGKNWKVVYRSGSLGAINASSSGGSEQLWAVGSAGTIIHLTLKS